MRGPPERQRRLDGLVESLEFGSGRKNLPRVRQPHTRLVVALEVYQRFRALDPRPCVGGIEFPHPTPVRDRRRQFPQVSKHLGLPHLRVHATRIVL